MGGLRAGIHVGQTGLSRSNWRVLGNSSAPRSNPRVDLPVPAPPIHPVVLYSQRRSTARACRLQAIVKVEQWFIFRRVSRHCRRISLDCRRLRRVCVNRVGVSCTGDRVNIGFVAIASVRRQFPPIRGQPSAYSSPASTGQCTRRTNRPPTSTSSYSTRKRWHQSPTSLTGPCAGCSMTTDTSHLALEPSVSRF